MAISVHLDIVSAEAQIFSGLAEMIVVSGVLGDLGILPGHAPLLANIKPGPIRVVRQGGEEELYYVSGGVLEVQPSKVTVLADTVVRAADIDEAAAVHAKEEAARTLSTKKGAIDFSAVLQQIARATAQLRTIDLLRSRRR